MDVNIDTLLYSLVNSLLEDWIAQIAVGEELVASLELAVLLVYLPFLRQLRASDIPLQDNQQRQQQTVQEDL